jgi:hypothetical protein
MADGDMSPLQAQIEQALATGPGVPLDLLEQAEQGNDDLMDRDKPDPPLPRKELVEKWSSRVKRAKKYWGPVFRQMKADQDFAAGYQWSKEEKDDRYVANLTLRIIAQRVAFFYAKNPKFIAYRRKRILNTVWDGDQSTLVSLQQAAGQMIQQAAPNPMTGQPSVDPAQVQAAQAAAAPILQDAMRVKQEEQQLDKIAKTLEYLFRQNVEQTPQDFKQMMKMVVRRTSTTGVGYVKLGFERVMQKRPEIEARISDISNRLSTLERLSADLHDDEVDENGPEAEELRLLVNDLAKQADIVVREGLTFDYPTSTSIIPDPKTMQLREFLGADWVAQEFILSPNDVKEIYEVDVGKSYNAYKGVDDGVSVTSSHGFTILQDKAAKTDVKEGPDGRSCCVWEVYHRKDGMVYVLCDGYPDFLREPAAPETYTDRFWPWFVLTLNDTDHETMIFPPSDVKLIRDMQTEHNRARQGMREHRRAARPKTVVSAGTVDAEDMEKLSNHPDNAIIELNGLQPGQKVDDLLQSFRGPPIDPNLYETEQVFGDMMRVSGVQDANIGGAKGGPSATQSNIAEASRATAMGSNIDDIDDMLSGMARTGSQILLQECSVDTVKRVVGEGAVWPEMSKQQIADELWLKIEAGSTGRPNQAQEIANAERIFPLLMQIPGIKPEFLAKELIKRLDDKLDITQAFQSMLPSILAMNGMASRMATGMEGPGGAMGGPPGAPPGPPIPGAGPAQGPAGAANAPQGPPPGAQRPPGQAPGAPPPNPMPGPPGLHIASGGRAVA